jgi:hypothetical protein
MFFISNLLHEYSTVRERDKGRERIIYCSNNWQKILLEQFFIGAKPAKAGHP